MIIVITGTLGAGKGEIVSYLKTKGFVHFSAREFLLEEVRKRGLPENRDSTTLVANDLREKNSPRYIIETLYDRAKDLNENSVIESVRAVGELDFLRKQKNFILIAIDADPEIRFERIRGRKSALDNVSYQKFISDEEREMHSDDPTKGNISECMRRADFLLMNNSTKEDLYIQIEKNLTEYKNKNDKKPK